eukprot:g25626.t1
MAEEDKNIATARTLKEEGNDLFKAKEYKMALAKYTKIFLWVNHLDVPTELAQMTTATPVKQDIKTQARELRLAANTNCATCYLRLNDLDKAKEFVERGLALDANSPRCRLIRGQVAWRTGDLETARSDLESVKDVFPQIVAKEMPYVAKKEKQLQKREREHWSRAFGQQHKRSKEADKDKGKDEQQEDRDKQDEQDKAQDQAGPAQGGGPAEPASE